MANITAANSVFMLSITGLYTTPQQLQGYAMDDVFDVPAVKPVETMMGVDGRLSAGFQNFPFVLSVSLQADSASNLIFENWLAAMQQQLNALQAQATITLPSVGRKYTMTNGYLTDVPPIASAKKVLQPRKYELTFETVTPASF
jgi:hypothetical protein